MALDRVQRGGGRAERGGEHGRFVIASGSPRDAASRVPVSRSRPGGCRPPRGRRPPARAAARPRRSARSRAGSACERRSPTAAPAATAARPRARCAPRARAPPRRAPRRRAACWRAARACTDGAARANSAAFGARSIDAAEVHHEHLVGDQLDDGEVVRDEDIGDAGLFLQVHQQVQHLRLDRDVERRDRLVGDDHSRLEHQRARDRDALALAAREHVRIARGSARARGRPAPASRGRARRARPAAASVLIASGSSSAWPIFLRGLRLANGFWNTICTLLPQRAPRRRVGAASTSAPSMTSCPPVGASIIVDLARQRALAAARFADDRERAAGARARTTRRRARAPPPAASNRPLRDRVVLRAARRASSTPAMTRRLRSRLHRARSVAHGRGAAPSGK